MVIAVLLLTYLPGIRYFSYDTVYSSIDNPSVTFISNMVKIVYSQRACFTRYRQYCTVYIGFTDELFVLLLAFLNCERFSGYIVFP